MRPELVDWLATFLPLEVARLIAPTWFTFIGLAGVVTLVLMLRAARRAGIDGAVVASAIGWGYVAAVAAGILVPMAIDAVEHAVRDGRPRVHWAGMTSFWGYLAGGVAVAIVARRAGGVPLPRLADLAAAPLGVALCAARLGCFVAGCDYGKVTSGPWAMRFPAGSPAWRDHVHAGLLPPGRAESLPVHPTQLYEAALGLAIAALAVVLARRGPRPGRVFLAAAAAYALGRLAIESVRGDVGRGFVGPLSSGQVFCVALLAAIGAALAWSHRRRAGVAVAAAAAVAALVAAPAVARAQPPSGDPAAPPAAGAPAAEPAAPVVSVGVLAGWSAPLNRRAGQVPPLAGLTLSAGVPLAPGLGAWLDLESHGNQDATHGTLLVSLGWENTAAGRWSAGARVGLGSTLVNFVEPAFRDVRGMTTRLEATLSLELSDRWVLWLRPVSFDVLSASDLGGPILAWQLRVGVAYEHRRPRAAAPPPSAPPPSAPPPGMSPPAEPAPPAPGPPAPAPPAEPSGPVDPYGARDR